MSEAEGDQCHAASGAHLRELLRGNHRYVFTLIQKFQTKWLGSSLLRPELTTRLLPMTNCAGVWSCAFENWGVMKENLKLEARNWDSGWHCFDVLEDPLEKNALPRERCSELEAEAMKLFGRLPGRKKD